MTKTPLQHSLLKLAISKLKHLKWCNIENICNFMFSNNNNNSNTSINNYNNNNNTPLTTEQDKDSCVSHVNHFCYDFGKTRVIVLSN